MCWMLRTTHFNLDIQGFNLKIINSNLHDLNYVSYSAKNVFFTRLKISLLLRINNNKILEH